MQRDRAARQHPLTSVAALRDPAREAERLQIGGEISDVTRRVRIPRDRLPVDAEVTVASAVGDEPQQLGRDVALLVGQPDEGGAGDRVARCERVGTRPSKPRADQVIVGRKQLTTQRERHAAQRTLAATDRAVARLDHAQGRRVPAKHALAASDGLDRVPVAVRAGHPCTRGQARDVVAHPGRADVVGVGDGAADRLRVADVAVGAEGAAQGVARLGAAAELVDGAGVDVAVHGDGDVAHGGEHKPGGGQPRRSARLAAGSSNPVSALAPSPPSRCTSR